MKRYAVAVAVLAMLFVGCSGDEPSSRSRYSVDATFADLCVFDNLTALNAIDHEQPSEGAVRAIIQFCERQYPGSERVGVEP